MSLQHLILLILCNSSRHGQSNHSSTPTRWKIPLELKRNSSKAQLEFFLLSQFCSQNCSLTCKQYSVHLLSATSECHFTAGSALEGVINTSHGSHSPFLSPHCISLPLTLVHHPEQKCHGMAWQLHVIIALDYHVIICICRCYRTQHCTEQFSLCTQFNDLVHRAPHLLFDPL